VEPLLAIEVAVVELADHLAEFRGCQRPMPTTVVSSSSSGRRNVASTTMIGRPWGRVALRTMETSPGSRLQTVLGDFAERYGTLSRAREADEGAVGDGAFQ
jgi:hypothetical protein